MLEKYPLKVLQPSQAEAAPKKSRGRPFQQRESRSTPRVKKPNDSVARGARGR
jgi:hypothetical protein